MFTHWTTETTDDNVVIHEWFGLRRLGPLGVTARDVPLPSASLVGGGSLQMQCLGQNLKGHIYKTLPAQRGWETGTLRTMVHVVDRSAAKMSTGIYVCATSTALVGGSGSAYLLGLSTADTERCVRLVKSTTGLQVLETLTPGLLVETPDAQWGMGADFTIGLAWTTADGKISFSYQQGLASDFSDLETIFQYTDPSPLSSPVSQGLWIASGLALEAVVFYDETESLREAV